MEWRGRKGWITSIRQYIKEAKLFVADGTQQSALNLMQWKILLTNHILIYHYTSLIMKITMSVEGKAYYQILICILLIYIIYHKTKTSSIVNYFSKVSTIVIQYVYWSDWFICTHLLLLIDSWGWLLCIFFWRRNDHLRSIKYGLLKTISRLWSLQGSSDRSTYIIYPLTSRRACISQRNIPKPAMIGAEEWMPLMATIIS